MREKKRALVVEGGAMRSIFSIGVLDVLIKKGIYDFDLCIGVSAGGTSLASYLAGMHERSFRVIVDYSTRKEFINIFNFIKGKHYMDLCWLWDYCESYDPLNVEKIIDRDIKFLVGVTSIDSGEVEYKKLSKENANELLKASCAIPVVYRNPVEVEGALYFDGGIADPIPIEEALKHEVDEIIVIRSRKKSYRMKVKNNKSQEYFLKKHPKIKKAFNERGWKYNKSIDLIRSKHRNINIIEINPPEEFKTSRFTKNRGILMKDYKLGIEAGIKLIEKFR